MTLDPRICYRAVRARDPRFDGRFYTAVLTTGVYCRPVCPARTPMRRNVRFYPSAAAAEAAGFRACMRCRPETSPGTPAWAGKSASVSRALRLIHGGYLDHAGVDELAACLGMTSRHLRRLFDEHLGAAPVAVAQARRVHFARRMLDETRVPVTEIAFGAGFGSIRRFNDVFKKSFGRSPSDFRRGRAAAGDGSFRLRLAARAPLDWGRLLAFIAPRAIAGIEAVEDGHYRRAVSMGPDAGVIEVARGDPGPAGTLVLHVPASLSPHALAIAEQTRRLFDLAADPDAIASMLARDPMLSALLSRYPGLRIPGAWDPFETSVRAILGQQVSVKGATTLANRLTEAHGEPVDTGDALLGRRFPRPEALARARVERLGLTRSRARTIRRLSAAAASGAVDLGVAADLDSAVAALRSLPGVGPWTAHYVAMRVYSEPDAFPSGDLALRRAARALDPSLESERRLVERAQAWRPWRAYATMLLWAWYSDHWDQRKDKS